MPTATGFAALPATLEPALAAAAARLAAFWQTPVALERAPS